MTQASRDENRIPTLLGVSSIDLSTPTKIAANPITGAMLIDGSSLYVGLDTRYLKLDGSNDPITGAISINTNSTTALLVEQDGVKDNVLIVDTTNGWVGVNMVPTLPMDITGRTFITGNDDAIQLTVKGNATQTANLFNILNSSSQGLATFSKNGFLTITDRVGTGSRFPFVAQDASGNWLVYATLGSSSNSLTVATVSGTDTYPQFAFNSTASTNWKGAFFGATRSNAGNVVVNGDYLFTIATQGWDGAAWKKATEIRCVVDGTPGASDMPGRIEFGVNVDGAASDAPPTRLAIYNNGSTVSYVANNPVSGTQIVTANLGLFVATNSVTANVGSGIGFGVTTAPQLVSGAAIVHERLGANDYGNLHFATRASGEASTANLNIRMTIGSDGSLTINDAGLATADVRAEGDTNANMLFLDASADAIMFGTATQVTAAGITLGLDTGITDAKNIILGTTTGTKIGTATTQKLAFYNSTPVVQATALTTQLTTITHTAPVTPDYAIQDFTQVTPFGFVTADEANTVLSVIANLQTRVSELETKLKTYGLLA
jgi:hypothetical protein